MLKNKDMKADELMLYDYVEDPDFGICEIVSIFLGEEGYNLVLNQIDDITKPFIHVTINGVKPIPITKENLIKFGFIELTKNTNNNYAFTVRTHNAEYSILKCKNDKYLCEIFKDDITIKGRFKYIHELQHVFKQAGIKIKD